MSSVYVCVCIACLMCVCIVCVCVCVMSNVCVYCVCVTCLMCVCLHAACVTEEEEPSPPPVHTRVPAASQDPHYFDNIASDASKILQKERIQEQYQKVRWPLPPHPPPPLPFSLMSFSLPASPLSLCLILG